MVDVSLSRRRLESGTLVVLVGVLLLTPSLTGQTAPRGMPSKAAAQSQSAPSGFRANVQAELDKLQAAIKAAEAAKDARAEAKALIEIGDVYSGAYQQEKALQSYNQAASLAHSANDPRQEAASVSKIAACYEAKAQYPEALDVLRKASSLAVRSHDLRGQAVALGHVANIYSDEGMNPKALQVFHNALILAQRAKDRGLEGNILRTMGVVYSDMGEREQALTCYRKAISIFHQLRDQAGEANTLVWIGQAYSALGDKEKALDYYNQALPIIRASGDRGSEANVLANAAFAYNAVGAKQKALELYGQVLDICRPAGNSRCVAGGILDIGLVYVDLGDWHEALDSFNQALPIFQEIGDRLNEAGALEELGVVSRHLGDRQKALDYFNQALPVLREAGDRDGQGTTLTYMGSVYADIGDKQEALDRYNQALPLLQAGGDREDEAAALNYIGLVYDGLGDKQKALDYYDQALPMAKAVSDPLLEAAVSRDLMLSHKDNEPTLAVFYGKQAINLLQQVRGNIQGLDKEIQSSFLASKNDYYHDLANLLIAQGRLPEAEQVIDILKQQEYRDYTRGEANVIGALTLTPAELQAELDYQASTAQIVVLGQEWADLRKISKRTSAQDARLKVVSDQLDEANAGLRKYYARLYTLLGEGSDANTQVANATNQASALKKELAQLPHTVALYTMVSKDGYRVIVITGSTQVAREYAIPQAEMNQKVVALITALEDYNNDAKAPALDLYKILMGPVENDLEQAGADTLVWSLDGVLRYVPMAALFDGKQYMVEKYKMVTITPASMDGLTKPPDVSRLSVAGMGISQEYQKDLPELPSVVGELDHVVRDPQVKGAVGVLPGQVLLNDAFTEKAMEDELTGHHAVVHIASHFVFSPGNDQESYLLLADGATSHKPFHLTVADFNDNQNLAMDDTELLTLSACQTGIGGVASNGREIDGLGMTAQKKGAKAVISTLWDVADDSTGELMADFYRRWAGGGGKVEKVEALRQSQLDLLLGTGRKGGSQFANPYYWAPFVLMGNWK
jgi:CHAT domain-containing protein